MWSKLSLRPMQDHDTVSAYKMRHINMSSVIYFNFVHMKVEYNYKNMHSSAIHTVGVGFESDAGQVVAGGCRVEARVEQSVDEGRLADTRLS